MELVFLLLWGILNSKAVTGLGNGKCPEPPYTAFAEITVDKIMVGTKGLHWCGPGYKRKIGASNVIYCKNDTGRIQWTSETFACIHSRATSQQSRRKSQSSRPRNPVTIVPSDTPGYCGMPKPVEYATVSMEYVLGQELHYKCLSGYEARPPTSDISVCKEEGGKIFWTSLRLQCHNDSRAGEVTVKCPAPLYLESAEITIDKFMVGSKVQYPCEPGYKSTVGQANFIVCNNDNGFIHWTTSASVCTGHFSDASQQSGGTPQRSAPENPVTIVPSDAAGYCGMPKPVEYATDRVMEYTVGQELHYKCLSGYDAQPPTSDISVCKEEGGKIFWTSLRLQCHNDSRGGEAMTLSLPITVAVIVFLIIFIILACLIVQKPWKERSSTGKVNAEKYIATAAAKVEMKNEEEAQRLKLDV
ncbi:interleukin-2 receptor subunit alpha isoform X2 [Carettochelys insculpta]|uniref:interleukin-2 receptor subunit alpha isoform X2 n=1 Tax=Carettochelys insculpta TaxID=44489 RepID=UPI003EBC51E2